MATHNPCVAQMGRVLDQEGHSLEACRFIFSEERKEQGLRVCGAGDMGGTSLPEFHLRRRAPRPAPWLGRHMALALGLWGGQFDLHPACPGHTQSGLLSLPEASQHQEIGKVFPLGVNGPSQQQLPGVRTRRPQALSSSCPGLCWARSRPGRCLLPLQSDPHPPSGPSLGFSSMLTANHWAPVLSVAPSPNPRRHLS